MLGISSPKTTQETEDDMGLSPAIEVGHSLIFRHRAAQKTFDDVFHIPGVSANDLSPVQHLRGVSSGFQPFGKLTLVLSSGTLMVSNFDGGCPDSCRAH